ncbi:CLIP domain-containing serine protease [Halocaridina rubra]|uniref:CLIP domain-containing serine protease n=1 Tax=Halocaridina rubra TaxID=373956 RepID=A0AAN8WMF0_HALRR
MRWQFMIAAFLVILGSGAAIPEDAWVWGTDTELKSPTFEEPSSSASSITLSALSTSTSPSTAVGTAQNDEEEEEPYESAESRSISDDPDIDISRSSDELLDGPTNDTEPRFIGSLKKKMCSVGLGLNCGHKGYKPAVQHYGKPADIHEVQYVQPVEIRPVGKPIPAVPKNHYGTHRDSSYATVPNTHGSASHGGSGGSYGSGHGGGGGGGYAAAASPSHYGESSSGGYAPAQAPSHYESPEPLSNLYGAPSNIAPSYGPPKASSIYSAPPPPSSSYNAPQNPGSSYNAPQGPAASYNAPQAPAASYNAPQAPAASYGAPQISGVGGGNGQTVKHIHIHQHVYKVDNSGGSGGQGGFGGGPSGGYRGGFDSNVISGSDHSFLSTPLSVGREAVDIKPSIKTIEKKEAFKAGKLSSPLNSVVGAPAGEYTIDNDGVTEPLRLAGSRELGCTCVRQEQCPPELVASSPFGREDLFGLQDPRNSPSSILSNETEALLPARFRREVKPPVDQLAIPSITQAQQSRELFPTEIHFDDSLYDDIISSDTMLETVGTGITIGDLLTPSAPSVNIVDTGRAKESLIEDVTNHIPQVIPSNRQYILACKNSGLQKEVRVRRDTKDSKEVKDSKEIRDSQTTTTNSDPATRLFGLLGSGLDGFRGPAFVPSFGVNFGSLPTGVGYGPYGSPHGNANPLGLDLGPVSVNPFVGFKVAKLDGRPILNPSLDLLVTPNAQGVHALEGIKKGLKNTFGLGEDEYYPGGYPPGVYPGGYPPGVYPGAAPFPGSPYPGGVYPGNGYPGAGLYPQAGGVYSPQSYTPTKPYKPSFAPHPPNYIPPQPYVPQAPIYNPSKPAYSPPTPIYTPSRPAFSAPLPPVSAFNPPLASPPRPVPIADYSTQSHRPLNHISPVSDFAPLPPKPLLHIPSKVHGNEKPVEIHHHEHTHYHDQNNGNNYNYDSPSHNGNFGTLFRPFGRKGNEDSKSGSSFIPQTPIRGSTSSSSSSIVSPSESSSFLPSTFSKPSSSAFSRPLPSFSSSSFLPSSSSFSPSSSSGFLFSSSDSSLPAISPRGKDVSATDRELKHFFEENEEKPSPRIFGHVANLLKALPLGLTFKISNVPHLEHLLPPTPLLGPTPLGIGSPGLPFLKKKLDSATDPSELSLDTHSSVDSLIRPSDRFPLLPQAEPHSYNSLTHSYDRFFPTKPSSHSSLPPLSPLTHSPSIIPSVFRPPRLFRPQTLVDKKVGAAASVHDTSPFRHPVPGLHGIGLNSFNIYGPGDPLFSQHGSQNAMCLQVSCRSLEYYCQRQLSSLVPSQCGLYEVCCNLDGFQGAFSSSFNSFTSTRACGIKNNDGVNGRVSYPVHKRGDAEFGEYPWQAAVLKKEGIDNVYICAGTMIDQSHILTAAHCIKGYAASQLRVRLGEYDVNQDTEFFPYFEADVNGVFVNPDFYSGNLINDIAVIRMASPVDFLRNPHISPICLPARGQDFTGQRCWVSGWGKDGFGDNGQYQSILKEVDLTVIPPLQCQQLLRRTRLGSSYQLHPGMICAGGEQGKDACKGDGGGPMACALPDGHYALAGIVSWGIGCGTPGIPGVYVNVAYYLDWISTIVNF